MLVGVVLAVATVNDLVRQTGINHRLIADLRTWRHYTGHDYHNISIDQETLGANTPARGAVRQHQPRTARTRGRRSAWRSGVPVVDGRRTVHGGWYLPPYVEDMPSERYGCFGAAGRGRCPR